MNRAALFAAGLLLAGGLRAWAGPEREPMTLRVVAVNPSAEKPKTVPVRIDLPQEITPTDILDQGEMAVEFDEDRSTYYVFKDGVTLNPKQTRVFQVVVRDIWFIPEGQLQALKAQTDLVVKRLEKSEHYAVAKQLAESIHSRLDGMLQVQSDETISRKSRIGAYRRNLAGLKEVKDDLARLEKLLSLTGGPPVPSLLEESPLKSDAPSTTTTWLVIFLIVIFMGLLAGQFFFTWQRRLKTPAAEPSEEFPQLPGSGSQQTSSRAGGKGEAP
jgi:hypothetical protein